MDNTRRYERLLERYQEGGVSRRTFLGLIGASAAAYGVMGSPFTRYARAAGDTPVTITIRSADGREVLATSQYRIRATAVSGVGTVLTIGAAAFLAVWWGRHWYRSRQKPKHAKRSRRAAADV